MKKIFVLTLSAIFSVAAFAQTEYDALRFGQGNITGTARYMSLGGAFGALGGDASALKDNPAGLGVYRSGEMSATLNADSQSANSVWYGDKSDANSSVGLKFNNFSYIINIPLWQEKMSGLQNSNFSFTYNRVKNFNRTMQANGIKNASFTDFLAGFTNGFTESALKYDKEGGYDPYYNMNVPWLSVLAYDGFLIKKEDAADTEDKTTLWKSAFDGNATSRSVMYESGGIGEYSFGWGGNFNNNLFIGANLNVADVTYHLTSILEEGFKSGSFKLRNELSQSGIGINLKLGAIYLPTNNLRLGAAIHTPTFYSVSEGGYAVLDYDNPAMDTFSSTGTAKGSTNVPQDGSQQNFSLTTAMQAQLSAAYLFGKSGLISAEYNFINYAGMRFSESDGRTINFEDENKGMKEALRNGHAIKIGAEYKPTPQVAFRAGYALMTGATNPDYTEGKKLRLETTNTNTEYFEQIGTSYASFGVGYRTAGWFVDFGYGLTMQNENFYPYQFNRVDLEAAKLKTNTHNVMLTFGLKM